MRRGGHATKANASAKLRAWRASPRFKAMVREAGLRGLAVTRAKPRCGAKAKSTGEPCRGTAMANGRCRVHGGRTPKGDHWHKTALPAKGAARGLERFEAKLAAQEKRKTQRRRELAMMTPEQRAKHEAWQASHAPGPASGREHRRRQLETKKMIDNLLSEADARRVAEEQRESALRAGALRDRQRPDGRAAKRSPAPAPIEDDQREPKTDVFA